VDLGHTGHAAWAANDEIVKRHSQPLRADLRAGFWELVFFLAGRPFLDLALAVVLDEDCFFLAVLPFLKTASQPSAYFLFEPMETVATALHLLSLIDCVFTGPCCESLPYGWVLGVSTGPVSGPAAGLRPYRSFL